MGLHWSKIEFDVGGDEDFRSAQVALTAEDKNLPRAFSRTVTEVARGLRDRARVEALTIPVRTDQHTGLRRRVSAGVRSVRMESGDYNFAGVRIVTMMDDRREAIIPRGMDGIKGWRHPVFGDRNNWVRQSQTSDSWFMETMRRGHEPMRNRLVNDINDAIDRIGKST